MNYFYYFFILFTKKFILSFESKLIKLGINKLYFILVWKTIISQIEYKIRVAIIHLDSKNFQVSV